MGSTYLIKNMDMVYFNGKVEIYIKVIMMKMKGMAMERCIGLMDQSIEANG